MSRSICVLPRVEQDINEIYRYLAKTDRDRAMAFFDAARLTFADLAGMPGKGRVYDSGEADLEDLHRWFVKGFKGYLILYRFNEAVVTIVRVIDGRRNIAAILDDL
jgi:toxin ParE1/3/4